MNPFDNVLRGNVDYFKQVSVEVLLKSRDDVGDSLLSRAVIERDLNCVKVIYEGCPELLYCQSNTGRHALHHAAAGGNLEILEFIINADVVRQGIAANKRLTRMQDNCGNVALMVAVQREKNAEAVKLLIIADPEFNPPPNHEHQTPLRRCIFDSHRKDMFKLILELAPNQSKTHMGSRGWTILHSAGGAIDTILDILQFCPDCSKEVDNKGQNFLHIAVECHQLEVVSRLLGAKKIPDSVLNMKDNNGNTPLHIAALSGKVELTKCFLYDSKVDKTTVNNSGQHVLEAITFDYDKWRAGVSGFTVQVNQKDLKDQSDFDLVVGALIATVSFTAGITVPGGYISDGPKEGTAVLSKKRAFQAFVILNTFALLFSLFAVFSHYCTRHLIKTKDIRYQLKVATNCTLGAIYTMMAAFIAGSFAVLADSFGLAISVCVICSCFYIFSAHPIWKIVMQKRGRSRQAATPTGGEKRHSP